MRRIRLQLAYEGTDFHGWQTQPGVPTIQGSLEAAIRNVLREEVRVTGSSRTDAGVHALGQVAAFSTESRLEPEVIQKALNANLPVSVRVWNAEEVAAEFHPIEDARSKCYRYLIDDHRPSHPLLVGHSWEVRRSLDVERMAKGGDYLVGKHDFRCFETSGSPRTSTVRTMFDVRVRRIAPPELWELEGHRLVAIEVEGDGFLYNMVRAIAGTLVRVGEGAESPEWILEVLASRDRAAAGPTAPPHGLYLKQIRF
jgi:tRNA pseudouridine38-40 synthase